MSEAADVPIVDLAPFFAAGATAEARDAVAAAMADACERIGFVLVTGHGVPEPSGMRTYLPTASWALAKPKRRIPASLTTILSSSSTLSRPGS